jgi:predicted nucleotidyltransferase
MTLAQLLDGHSNAILFECIAGSRAYGTHLSVSDEDRRGIFAVPAGGYLALRGPPEQVGDQRGDTVFYSLRRTVELLSVANPNILELLFTPDDCVRRTTASMQKLISRRDLFITRQCADTHAGYAMSQIKKARGQNKWINNPRPEQPPSKEDFCHVVPWNPATGRSPQARPVSLRSLGWDLGEYHVARLEHARDTYRLYHFGKTARGVFRGDALVCESISREDELERFAGLLLFNEQAWKQSLVDHQNYWAWRRNRNPARWEQQERGELDFDAKNMMHTIRLLLSGRSILMTGAPKVRFEGDELVLLKDIRAGGRGFEEILEIAEALVAECEALKAASLLPDACDLRAADELLQEITAEWEQRVE